MTSQDAALAEARGLARMVITVADRARGQFAAAVKPIGVPVHVARTLLALDEPRSMREVAGELACDPSHVTGIADSLEEEGMLCRAPGRDRRVKMLHLTEQGRELRQRIADAVDAQARFASSLTAEQRAQLHDLLEALMKD